MNVIGVIAEYNPFHNGHAYQLQALKERTGADYVVVAMSGNYVQRGEPAIVDKYARTQMALENGADLVLELPVQWATASAEKFAQGGVELLAATGVVDFLGFGAESNELEQMREIAQILADEPEPYRAALGEALRGGINFPTARMQALRQYLASSFPASCSYESKHLNYSCHARNLTKAPFNYTMSDNYAESDNYTESANKDAAYIPELLSDLLSEPNNILAIEYLKALRRGNYTMEPVLIPRIGAGYHDEDTKSEYASATAIRKKVFVTDKFDCLKTYLPASCVDILSQYQSVSRFLCANDFSQILGYRLLALREIGYDSYADISSELSSRILRKLYEYRSFSQFCELLKTKELTYTRISRALLHLVLDIPKDTSCSHIPYLRILGFRRGAEPLLHEMKKNATLPIITKMADAPRTLEPDALEILQREIFVSDLYAQIAQNAVQTDASTRQSKNDQNNKPYKNDVNHGLIII